MSIIPKGFEVTAHPIFNQFRPPQLKTFTEIETSTETLVIKKNEPFIDLTSTIDNGEIVESAVEAEISDPCALEVDLQSQSVAGTETSLTNSTHNKNDTEKFSLICPICLESYEDPVTIISCKHNFCHPCIDLWFAVNKVCPLCKDKQVFFIKNASSTSPSEHDEGVVKRKKKSKKRSHKHPKDCKPQLEIWTYYDTDKDKKKPKIKSSSSEVQEAIVVHREFQQSLKD